jgi:hypothetical protein
MNIAFYRKNIEETLQLLRDGDADTARTFFNTTLAKLYEKELASDEKYFQLTMFLGELDDYLNDGAVQILGATNLEELQKSYSEIVLW